MIIEKLKDVNIYTSKEIKENVFEVTLRGYIAAIENMKDTDRIHIGIVNNEIILQVDIKAKRIFMENKELNKPLIAKFMNGRILIVSISYLLYKDEFIDFIIKEIETEFRKDICIFDFNPKGKEELTQENLNELIETFESQYEDFGIDHYLLTREFDKVKEILAYKELRKQRK